MDQETATLGKEFIFGEKIQFSFPVTFDDWRRLEERINKIYQPTQFFHSLGFSLFGFSFASLLAGIGQSVSGGEKIYYAFFFIVSALTFLGSLLCGIMVKEQKSMTSYSKEIVIAEMERIKSRCSPPARSP